MKSDQTPQPGYSPRPITIVLPPGTEIRIISGDSTIVASAASYYGGDSKSPSPRPDSKSPSPSPRP
ncbi:MAG: hypothetical protein AAB676_07455 [Verrucomicrobiota bacterium]